MEFWYSEKHTENVYLSIKVNKQLYSSTSRFQRIDVFESLEFGRFLALDGFMMLTEKDEFIYHEMITHVPMAVNPNIKTVLVIGAGDGGVLRELTKYPSIDRIDVAEIDEEVVRVCKQFLPKTACGFEDKRVNMYYQDGMKFIRRHTGEYDLIIVDSTDPFGPGEGLFTKEFYGNCYNALKEDGIMVNQHESPFYEEDAAAMNTLFNTVPLHFIPVDILKYPRGGTFDLIQLVKRSVKSVENITISRKDLFIDSVTALSVYEAIVLEMPSMTRFVSVCGEAMAENKLFKVRIGTPIKNLLAECGGFCAQPSKIIMNGCIYGSAVNNFDTPITKYTKSITILRKKMFDYIPISPCIRCGNCRKICVADLQPDKIFTYHMKKNQFTQTEIQMTLLCSECRLCNMVCPSRLPLFQTISEIKKNAELRYED